jgi:hypothetical protein
MLTGALVRGALVDIAAGVGLAAVGLVNGQACREAVVTEAGVVRLARPLQVAWLCAHNQTWLSA